MDLRRHSIGTMNDKDLDRVREAAAGAIQICGKYDTRASLDGLDPAVRDFLQWQIQLAQTQALVAIGEELALARKQREAARYAQRLG